MKKKIIILWGMLAFLIFLNITSNVSRNDEIIYHHDTKEEFLTDIEIPKEPKIAKSWHNFTFIHIKNNWTQAKDLGWCSGDGSYGNPYTLENITIDAKGGAFGIFIEDSVNDYFMLRNCTVYNQSGEGEAGGILLMNTNNGTIINCNTSDCEYGITLLNANNHTIKGNSIENCEFGLFLLGGIPFFSECYNISLDDNNFINCGLTVGGSLQEVVTYNITTLNTVNNKPIYFYANSSNLTPNNFTGAGEVLCYYCNNSRISDLNVPYGGISLDTCLNITIDNVTASFNPLAGVDIIYCQNITVIKSKTNDNINYGIRLFYSTDCNVSNNRLHNELNGIYLVRSFDNTISNNTMTDCGIAIDDEDEPVSSNNDIDILNTVNGKIVYYYEDNNTLGLNDFTNAGQIILLNCSVSELSHFNLSHTSQGMYLYLTKCPLIYNNSLEHNGKDGIFMIKCNKTKVYQNEMNHCGSGLVLRHCLGFNITENNFTYCLNNGADIYVSKNTTITFNNFSYNGESGILVSENSTLTDNTISHNTKHGIYVGDIDNIIYINHIYQNGEAGIYIDSYRTVVEVNEIYNNTNGIIINSNDMNGISNNLVANNSGYGLAIFGGTTINNNIYYNNFSNNLVNNGYDEGSNLWDDGVIGNRWDDYTGKDTDDDGLGDTGYPISGGSSQDDHPIYWDPPVFEVTLPLNYTLYGKDAPAFSGIVWESVPDTQWYTLGNNPKKYNFTGIFFSDTINQTGWNAFGNGTVLIHFFVNDSRGLIVQNDTIVRKDIIPPNITIINPIENKVYNATAPNFDITITGLRINESWYRVHNGSDWSKNYTIGGLGSQRTGQIDQDAWNDCPNGTVVIEFYANDTVNNIGVNSTTVRKDILGPVITINNPTPNDLFSSTAPGLGDCNVGFNDVSVVDATWHMLINATNSNHYTKNYTWNDKVNQTAWDQMGNGTVIIRIFANDSLGYIGMAEVTVRKDIELPSILINKPALNKIFGNNTFNFTITVSGKDLHTIWYMLINGTNSNDYTNNHTYSETVSAGIIEDPIEYTLWNQYENGTVIIRFFLNRTNGVMVSDQVLVRKDIIAPNITIVLPVENQTVSRSPPNFIVSIKEGNIHTKWYRLFNGTDYSGNFTFITNTIINKTEWEAMWDSIKIGENITIIFYCNDTAGNLGFANVTVIKQVSQSTPPISNGDGGGGGKRKKEGFDIVEFITSPIGLAVTGGSAGGVLTVSILIKKRISVRKRIKEIERIERLRREK